MINRKINKIFQFISFPFNWILDFHKIFKPDLWVITGHEQYSKEDLTISYSGDIRNKNFIVKLAFDHSYDETYVGKVWLWRAAKFVQKKNERYGLHISEIPVKIRLFCKRKNNFFLPLWIDGEIDTTSNISSDSLKTDIRRIKKNNLRYEISDEISMLHKWYYQMYLPYITQTFDKRAFIFSYDYFRKNFGEHGIYKELFLIKQENEIIAGILMGHVKYKIYLYDLGVKNGNNKYVKNGAIGALFCGPTIYSEEKGFKSINYGFSRPFLNDGVLQFKKKRGICIKNTWNKVFVIRPLSNSDGVKQFLLNNPFIYMEKNKYYGAIFVNDAQTISESYLERTYKDYFIPGLSMLNIYNIGQRNNNLKGKIPSPLFKRIRMCDTENIFSIS